MKHHFLPLATTTTLFFFLLLLLSATANGDNDFVRDTVGNPVVTGGEYYIYPYNHDPHGGGLTWSEHRKLFALCPDFNVIQSKVDVNEGEATSIYPINTKTSKIRLSTKVNIGFPKISPPASLPIVCYSSTNLWKVQDERVRLGGEKGDNENSVFMIEEHHGGGYVITYCPKKQSGYGCGGLGITELHGERRLVVYPRLARQSLPVVFSPEPIVDSNRTVYGKYAAV